MRWIESGKKLMETPGMQNYYKFMDDADATGSSQWWMMALLILCLCVALMTLSEVSRRRKPECGKGLHRWRGRGAFGCHCPYCDITLKEFVEKGGEV